MATPLMTTTRLPASGLNVVGNLQYQWPGSSDADKAVASTAISVIDDDTITVFRDIRTLRDLWNDTSKVIVLRSLVWTNALTLCSCTSSTRSSRQLVVLFLFAVAAGHLVLDVAHGYIRSVMRRWHDLFLCCRSNG